MQHNCIWGVGVLKDIIVVIDRTLIVES
jgi:hypothetical protein